MRNLKRIRALTPLFPRYRLFKMHTKRGRNEKWSFLENSRVFKWKFFKASHTARAICSGLRVNSYLISTTLDFYWLFISPQNTQHFVSYIARYQKKNGWGSLWCTADYPSLSSPAYHHVLLINNACSYPLLHVSIVRWSNTLGRPVTT